MRVQNILIASSILLWSYALVNWCFWYQSLGVTAGFHSLKLPAALTLVMLSVILSENFDEVVKGLSFYIKIMSFLVLIGLTIFVKFYLVIN